MFFLKKLLSPSEVKVCLLVLEEIKTKANNLSFSIIEAEIKHALVNNVEKVQYAIIQERKTPKHLILIMMLNVLAEKLTSGYYHVYRGVLSMEGAHFLEIWQLCITEMLDEGYSSQEKFEEDRVWIKEQVRSAG